MPADRRAVLVVATVAILAGATARAQAPAEGDERAPRVHQAHPRGDAKVRIDGALDEPVWQRAPVGDAFVERTPVPGSDPPVETTYRVLYDREALYVGVRSELLPDETPRALELQRDSFDLYSDDAVTLKIDVRHDRRTTNGFATNPAGTQLDYVATGNGLQFRNEFDAVWEVETRVTDDAWVAEFRIPVTALGLPPHRGDRVVGLNVTRDHNARRATYDWSHIPPEFGPVSAVHYGELHGLDGMATGRPIRIIPYVLAGWRQDDPSRFPSGTPWQAAAGGDVQLRLGRDVWSEVTVLTDFAQVDLDDPRVNLDRFPLFFPEKRPFFLTGLDVFDFGEPGVAQLFFSRRIGLDENADEVPMYAGVKTYGRVGDFSFGALDVLTGEPETNWAVTRARYNLAEGTHVGALATVRTARGETRPDTSVGADFAARALESRLQMSGFFAGTLNGVEPARDAPEPTPVERDEEGLAGRLEVGWRGEEIRPRIEALWIDEDFDPQTGFVRRRDRLLLVTQIPWIRRTRKLGLERVVWRVGGSRQLSHDLQMDLGGNAEGEMTLEWRNGVAFEAVAGYLEDTVREDFELVPGVPIEAGDYQGPTARFRLSTSSQRNPFVSLQYSGNGAFFGGVAQTLTVSGGFAAGPHVSVTSDVGTTFVRLPGEDPFQTITLSSTATVAPTTDLFGDVTFQLNNIQKTTALLARIRWRYLPGSDLFLVYREDRPYADPDPTDMQDPELERRVVLKMSYRYEALL